MKTLLKIFLGLVVLGVGGAAAFPYARAYWRARHKVSYRQAAVVRGEVMAVVNSTGTVQPVLRVSIGSFVSGPIKELLVDFNTEVRAGEVLAKIDPRIYDANYAREQAAWATSKAEVARVKALLAQARNNEKRAQALRATNESYISDTEMDQFKYTRVSFEAQLEVAEAAVRQADANVAQAKANLGYTDITSPVDGIVIDRKIDRGQTLAAQFQTPELFVVAPDMDKKMYIYASVDEADIGLIRKAQEEKRKVEFTIDAYPDDLFEGVIAQVRMNPTTTQNVVTYPVVVEAPNPQRKLLPGMTANLSFEIDKHEKALKIPNAALRFYPKLEQVRPEDRKVLEGAEPEKTNEEESTATDRQRSATERAEAGRKRNRRHVWVVEEELLKAIEVTTGLSESKFTELVSGEITEGQQLVTGVATPTP